MTEHTSIHNAEVNEAAQNRLLDTPEIIDRLAADLRAKTAGELPHAYYVDQVKRQLAGKGQNAGQADDADLSKEAARPSVFDSWAKSS